MVEVDRNRADTKCRALEAELAALKAQNSQLGEWVSSHGTYAYRLEATLLDKGLSSEVNEARRGTVLDGVPAKRSAFPKLSDELIPYVGPAENAPLERSVERMAQKIMRDEAKRMRDGLLGNVDFDRYIPQEAKQLASIALPFTWQDYAEILEPNLSGNVKRMIGKDMAATVNEPPASILKSAKDSPNNSPLHYENKSANKSAESHANALRGPLEDDAISERDAGLVRGLKVMNRY